MTYDDFKSATLPKIKGTLNLHKFLHKQLEFFVMLSSSTGVVSTKPFYSSSWYRMASLSSILKSSILEYIF
jgi:KR domain